MLYVSLIGLFTRYLRGCQVWAGERSQGTRTRGALPGAPRPRGHGPPPSFGRGEGAPGQRRSQRADTCVCTWPCAGRRMSWCPGVVYSRQCKNTTAKVSFVITSEYKNVYKSYPPIYLRKKRNKNVVFLSCSDAKRRLLEANAATERAWREQLSAWPSRLCTARATGRVALEDAGARRCCSRQGRRGGARWGSPDPAH